MDIVTAYRVVGTYRGAAEMCGVTHKTVKRVVERDEVALERVARRRNYESVRALVAAKITATKGQISAKRLLPALRAAGYAGSDRNFRRLVAQEHLDGSAAGHGCISRSERGPGAAVIGELLLLLLLLPLLLLLLLLLLLPGRGAPHKVRRRDCRDFAPSTASPLMPREAAPGGDPDCQGPRAPIGNRSTPSSRR